VRNSACYLAPVVVLIAGLSLARGETVETDAPWNPWWLRVVTQAPVTIPLSKTSVVPPSDPAAYPPSGVVPAPPPAPVGVPSSGVVQATHERRTITIMSVKQAPSPRSAGVASPTRTARHFVPRRTAVRSATQQKREDVARDATTARATTLHETTATQPVVVETAATVQAAVEPQYYNYAAPAAISRSRARILSANRVPVRSSAPLVDTAIAVGPTTPMPMYRYVYETDRILVIDPHTGIAVQAIPR
jgi:hypothetical protein